MVQKLKKKRCRLKLYLFIRTKRFLLCGVFSWMLYRRLITHCPCTHLFHFASVSIDVRERAKKNIERWFVWMVYVSVWILARILFMKSYFVYTIMHETRTWPKRAGSFFILSLGGVASILHWYKLCIQVYNKNEYLYALPALAIQLCNVERMKWCKILARKNTDF